MVLMPRTCFAVPEHGVALLAIPKCGAQSVNAAAILALGGDPGSDIPRHPLVVKRAMRSDEAKLQGLRVFAVVRHPLARLVSLWANKIRQPTARGTASLRRLGYDVGMSFRNFVEAVAQRRDQDRHTLRQVDFCAPGGRWSVDTLMRMELLPFSWRAAQQACPSLPELPRENATEHAPWPQMYDRETLQIATDLYRADLEALGYAE